MAAVERGTAVSDLFSIWERQDQIVGNFGTAVSDLFSIWERQDKIFPIWSGNLRFKFNLERQDQIFGNLGTIGSNSTLLFTALVCTTQNCTVL